ncbi:TPA: hypothetical protein ACH3X1_005265 [Trebouxia sp. C0004]
MPLQEAGDWRADCLAASKSHDHGRSCTWTHGQGCHSVLHSQDYQTQPVILRLSSPDYITNIPGRLTGRQLFSTHLMAKQGQLVDVPQEMTSDIITVKQLADYLEPILTGGSLDAYHLRCRPSNVTDSRIEAKHHRGQQGLEPRLTAAAAGGGLSSLAPIQLYQTGRSALSAGMSCPAGLQ